MQLEEEKIVVRQELQTQIANLERYIDWSCSMPMIRLKLARYSQILI